MSYPKWLYHKTEAPKLLVSEEQELALGKGWEDTPAAFTTTESESIAKESGHKGHEDGEPIEKMTKAELEAELLKKGADAASFKGMNKSELFEMLKGL